MHFHSRNSTKKIKKIQNKLKKNIILCVHACIFKGTKSTSEHLYMYSQNPLFIFFRISCIHKCIFFKKEIHAFKHTSYSKKKNLAFKHTSYMHSRNFIHS